MHVMGAAELMSHIPHPSTQLCCPVLSLPQWVNSIGAGSICVLAADAVGLPMLRRLVTAQAADYAAPA